MRAHYLQHVPFEGLGSIHNWLNENHYELTCTRLYKEKPLPTLDEIDLLIIMGGPMSVNDESQYPWLIPEKQFIREAIERKIPTIGICLGSQLIASASGKSVYPNLEKEIGWFPLFGKEHKSHGVFPFPDQQTVFHWHGETFDLPDGATLLASSQACRNQAFQIDKHVLAFQFHLETNAESAQLMVENCADELKDTSTYIQNAGQIIQQGSAHYSQINSLMDAALAYLTQQS